MRTGRPEAKSSATQSDRQLLEDCQQQVSQLNQAVIQTRAREASEAEFLTQANRTQSVYNLTGNAIGQFGGERLQRGFQNAHEAINVAGTIASVISKGDPISAGAQLLSLGLNLRSQRRNRKNQQSPANPNTVVSNQVSNLDRNMQYFFSVNYANQEVLDKKSDVLIEGQQVMSQQMAGMQENQLRHEQKTDVLLEGQQRQEQKTDMLLAGHQRNEQKTDEVLARQQTLLNNQSIMNQNMLQNFAYMGQEVRNEFQNLNTAVANEIENSTRMLSEGNTANSLQRFEELINDSNDVLDGTLELSNEKEGVQRLNNGLVKWAKFGGSAAGRMYTGAIFLEEKSNSHAVAEALKNITPEQIPNFLGYLSHYAANHLRIVLFNESWQGATAVFNPFLWLKATNTCSQLRSSFPQYFSAHHAKQLDDMEDAVENQKTFIQALQTKSELYERLFVNYENALQIIKDRVRANLIEQVNAAVLDRAFPSDPNDRNKIKLDEKNTSMAEIDNDEKLTSLLLSRFEGALPANNWVRGDTNTWTAAPTPAHIHQQAENTRYSTMRVKYKLPPELLLLERLGLGNINMRYYRIYADSNMVNFETTIDVKVTYGGKASHYVVKQYTENGKLYKETAPSNSVSMQQHQAREGIVESMAKLRKHVVETTLAQSEVKHAIATLNANRYLLHAYAVAAGFKQPELDCLLMLDSEQMLTHMLTTFSINSSQAGNIILAKIRNPEVNYFEDRVCLTDINRALSDLMKTTQSHESKVDSDAKRVDRRAPSTASVVNNTASFTFYRGLSNENSPSHGAEFKHSR